MSQSLYPTFRFHDAHAAIAWLEATLGAERKEVHEDEGVVHHAELRVAGDVLMLGSYREDGPGHRPGQSTTYVAVDDVDAYWDRAREAGAEVVRELADGLRLAGVLAARPRGQRLVGRDLPAAVSVQAERHAWRHGLSA